MAADVTKKLTLKNGSSTQTKNIGAEAQYIDVGFDSNGDIIEDITQTTPTTTESTAKVLKDIIADKAPKNHVSSTAEYGAASNSSFGHVKTGSTINNVDGVINVKYGTTANTAAQGNDSRLSDARKNPNAVTFSDGKATPTTKAYDGSSAETITYTDVGAAPQSHASSSTTYGVASKNNYGHVKIGTGISVNNGIISATGSGHIIENDEGQAMTSRPTLQFEGVNVVDDENTEKTIIKPQIQVCATEEEWNQMTDAEKNDPLVYWDRPWANSDAFATDRTPIGTVVSVAGSYDSTQNTPTGRFPSNDYLVCNGATIVDGKNVSKQIFPKLAEYFQEAYGNFQYFGTGGGGTDDFSLPDWSADFPENGILCIKAQISSTTITFTEVDDESVTEDNVWSAKKVSDYLYNMRRRVLKNITSEIQEDNGARLIAAIAEQDLAKYGFAIGDFFIGASGYYYYLADLNTYYGGYTSYATIAIPHITIIVDTKTTTAYQTSGTVTRYVLTTLHTFLKGTVLTNVKSDLTALFGDWSNHLLSNTEYYPVISNNAVSGEWSNVEGGDTGGCYITALTESQVYGHPVRDNSGTDLTGFKQLEIFRKFTYMKIFGNVWIWLRNLISASHACYAGNDGAAYDSGVSGLSGRGAGLIKFH